ncbi:hypothetical protein OROGR_004595 [Orobanche gracilis]
MEGNGGCIWIRVLSSSNRRRRRTDRGVNGGEFKSGTGFPICWLFEVRSRKGFESAAGWLLALS